MSQPSWKLVANLGDVNPLDYGGYFVFVDETGVYPPEAELLVINDDCQILAYRFVLKPCTFIDGVLSDNRFHPDHCAWFATTAAKMAARPQDGKGLADIAAFTGIEESELVGMLCSEDPIELALAYRAIGEYHGFDNLDSYPLEMSHAEARARYKTAKYAVA